MLNLHFGRPIPDESTLRKNYLWQCYDNTISKVQGKKIFISIDKMTDVEHRYVANVVIGTLEIDEPSEVFLLTSEVLETINHSTICRLFEKCMFLFWPEGIRYDDVLLVVIDAAPYIVKAGMAVQAFYLKLVHITCFVHGLHRVAEDIRAKFSQVDFLVPETKKIFVKAPFRKQLFKSMAPGLLLRPFPDWEKCYRKTESWRCCCNWICQVTIYWQWNRRTACFHKGKFQLLNARNHTYPGERCKSGKFSDFT